MSQSVFVYVFVFLMLWTACFLFAVFLLNIFFFNMSRTPLKKCLKIGDLVVFVILPPILMVAFRNTSWGVQVFSLQPEGLPAKATLWSASVIWGIALVAQAFFTLRTLRPSRIFHLVSNHTRILPFLPKEEDWDLFRGKGASTFTLKGNHTPPPSHKRQVTAIPHDSVVRRMIMSWPLSLLDKSYQLQVHEITLEFPQFPSAFDGIRVLHLSDSHYGALLSPRYYQFVIEQASALKPDLIVITGDYTAADHLHRESVELFACLEAPMGVWTIRGNHDYYTESEIMGYWIEYYGIKLLTNRSVEFERDGQVFRLVGVEHPFQPVSDWAGLVGEKKVPDTFCLVLSHKPDNIVPLSRTEADFVLAGHTHGGQWRLPFIGPVFIPSSYGRFFDQGFRILGKTLLYTSRGFGGHTFPLRLNCPPEIALFTLQRQKQDQKPAQ